jgi:multidrug efflux pump subunit AcrA (membrane-fusion protein)
MRVFAMALGLLLGGCSAAPPATTPVLHAESPASVKADRGSITSTLVIPATVRAGVRLEVTDPGTLADPAGLVIERVHVKPGTQVPQNFPLATAHAAGFALVAPLGEASAYKLYSLPAQATGQIKEGPGPFPCPLPNRVPSQPRKAGWS